MWLHFYQNIFQILPPSAPPYLPSPCLHLCKTTTTAFLDDDNDTRHLAEFRLLMIRNSDENDSLTSLTENINHETKERIFDAENYIFAYRGKKSHDLPFVVFPTYLSYMSIKKCFCCNIFLLVFSLKNSK